MNDFDKYYEAEEPGRRERAYGWATAIGLQDVDGLKASEYLIETAKQNIEGDITIAQVKDLLDSYYRSKSGRQSAEERTEEADKVSSRIAEILTEPTFNFSPDYLLQIHSRLFTGIFKEAGIIRPYNITKKEWVLDGDTVLYSSYDMIKSTLEYVFREERNTDYSSLNALQAVRQICRFISGLWQIHPFCEGNTRTTAVFAIKYLRSFGFEIDNDSFAENSWYFRNALVRANYSSYYKNVKATPVFLEHFFENLLLGGKHELKNREMHITYRPADASPLQNGTLNVTSDEKTLLKVLREDPKATQDVLASRIGKSVRTVKRLTSSLTCKGLLVRENGKRNGFWKVVEIH